MAVSDLGSPDSSRSLVGHAEQFVAWRWGLELTTVAVAVERLRGGLESEVALARVITAAPHVPGQLVIKVLRGDGVREAGIYAALRGHLHDAPSPHIFGEQMFGEQRYVYMEMVAAVSWPWSQTESAAAVSRALARLHTARLPREPFAWNYDDLLMRSAAQTLDLAQRLRDTAGIRYWPRLGDLRRVVRALPVLRRRLLEAERVVIHGDVHPGNAMVRDAGRDPCVTLIDWGRARVGSPMEDLASWLHSLGCWEPAARRRHDTLLRAYCVARGVEWPASKALRRLYWFAAVSNGLSGAIAYHLAVIADPTRDEASHANAQTALRAWARVVRRGAALLGASRSRSDHRARGGHAERAGEWHFEPTGRPSAGGARQPAHASAWRVALSLSGRR
jgi:aminoglycoside phosphotransferase (APT) family kinase protein